MARKAEPPSPDQAIDWLAVLKRLSAYARQRLLFEHIGRSGKDIAIRGLGDGAHEIAVEVWEDAYTDRVPLPGREGMTTSDVVGVLIHRLKHRFLDKVRRRRDGAQVMVWETEHPLDVLGESADGSADAVITPVRWREIREWLLAAAKRSRDPLLYRYVDLQCSPEDFMDYGRSEAAELLGVSPDDITNVKKRVQRLLQQREKERRL